MSAQYSTNLRTQYYEPSSHVANKMTTFRLDKNALYMPNLRILNLGYSVDAADLKANALAGHYGCIHNIRLMDGSKTLSQLRNANKWLSFKNQLGKNQHKLCVDSPNNGAQVGYVLDSNSDVQYIPANGTTLSDAGASEIATSVLDLRHVFPMLNNVDAVDCSVFQQLRVEIEYESNSAKAGVSKSDATMTVQEPTLAADMVVNDAIASKMRSSAQKVAQWDEIENDLLFIPAQGDKGSAGLNKQSFSGVINGFDGKLVGRIAILKHSTAPATECYTANVSQGFGSFQSRNYNNERLQIRKNGTNVFGGNGIDNDSYKSLLLWSSWGDVCVPPFATKPGIGSDDADAAPINDSGVFPAENNKQSNRVGGADYYGISIEDTVNQFQIEFDRDCYDNTGYPVQNSAINMYVFGEVRKQLVIKDGSYSLVYA